MSYCDHIVVKGYAGSDKKVSEHTIHCILLQCWTLTDRAVKVHMRTTVHFQSTNSEHQNWIMQRWRTGTWSDVVLQHTDGRLLLRRLPEEHRAPGCTMERRQPSGGSVMLLAMFCWETTIVVGYMLLWHAPPTWVLLQKCYTISLNDVKFQQAGSQKTKMVQEVMIPTQVSICEICWTNESDLWMPHLQLTGLKGSVAIVTSWCEIPRRTFRGRVEFMARQVRAVLATKRRPTWY